MSPGRGPGGVRLARAGKMVPPAQCHRGVAMVGFGVAEVRWG
eukprot:CAMPEP_0183561038 /NCGR_PEP_ID=MMETSP0371-20130417/96495_1 /TAXON_ID=268820 /ORGANISM="Peridinium aciculiferum, Strain PAER-2" /LENGTH=41 /DNA_ID= /DNA_START= /DNA_END= /DNA_ORIENTATION=